MVELKDYLNLSQYRRVLTVAETPSKDEFFQVLKITSAGIVILGLLGFFIYVIVFILPGGI